MMLWMPLQTQIWIQYYTCLVKKEVENQKLISLEILALYGKTWHQLDLRIIAIVRQMAYKKNKKTQHPLCKLVYIYIIYFIYIKNSWQSFGTERKRTSGNQRIQLVTQPPSNEGRSSYLSKKMINMLNFSFFSFFLYFMLHMYYNRFFFLYSYEFLYIYMLLIYNSFSFFPFNK